MHVVEIWHSCRPWRREKDSEWHPPLLGNSGGGAAATIVQALGKHTKVVNGGSGSEVGVCLRVSHTVAAW